MINKLKEYNINHVTIELETTEEKCQNEECSLSGNNIDFHSHHHH